MPRSFVLLCPPIDGRWLASLILVHNPTATVTAVSTDETLETALAGAPSDVRLIGFLTDVVVPARMLARLDGPAYNFHPGPPAYPGRHPIAFALYDGATRYGATAHEMAVSVDSGPIVGALEFDVPPGADHGGLLEWTYRAMIRLFLLLAPRLALSDEPLPRAPAAWSGRSCSNKALARMCELSPDLPAEEIERRLHAFRDAEGATLTTTLHGRRFTLASK